MAARFDTFTSNAQGSRFPPLALLASLTLPVSSDLGPPASRPRIFCASWSHRFPNQRKPHSPSHLSPQLPATLTCYRWVQPPTSLLSQLLETPQPVGKVQLSVLISSLLWLTANHQALQAPTSSLSPDPLLPKVTQRNPGSSRAPTIPPPSTNLSALHVCPFSLRKKGLAPASCPSLSRARSCQAFPSYFGPLCFLTPVPFRNQRSHLPRRLGLTLLMRWGPRLGSQPLVCNSHYAIVSAFFS